MLFDQGTMLFDCWSAAEADLLVLKQAGYVGAIRYIDGWWPGSSFGKRSPVDKSIGDAELASFKAAGLGLQLVWQTNAGFSLNGYAQGVTDGRQAREQALALGYPIDRKVVYFAVDTNVDTSNHPAIVEYRRGFAESIPIVGCYGEAALLEALKAGGLISAGWLPGAASWSDYRSTAAADVVQLTGSPVVGGITIDRNWVQTTVDLWQPAGDTTTGVDMAYVAEQTDGAGRGTVWIVGEEKRLLVSAADWPATSAGINELIKARVYGGYVQLPSSALDRVPTAAGPAPTAAEIARAVVAVMPPATGGGDGGMTYEQIEQAVAAVLARTSLVHGFTVA